MSKLTDFYLNEDTDNEGRWLHEIWQAPDHYLEKCHSHVQWLFPLTEPSNFNPDAPLLTQDDIALFHTNPQLKDNLKISFNRFLEFLGLKYEPPYFKLITDDNVFVYPNHNWLRISRMLKSMSLLGLREDAVNLYNYLENCKYGSENSRKFWQDAIV